MKQQEKKRRCFKEEKRQKSGRWSAETSCELICTSTVRHRGDSKEIYCVCDSRWGFSSEGYFTSQWEEGTAAEEPGGPRTRSELSPQTWIWLNMSECKFVLLHHFFKLTSLYVSVLFLKPRLCTLRNETHIISCRHTRSITTHFKINRNLFPNSDQNGWVEV